MKLWTWEEKNLPSISHAIRTAAAAIASVILARLVQMPEAYRAAIATLVVMQSTLGATLTLSLERIVATAVGCVSRSTRYKSLAVVALWPEHQRPSRRRASACPSFEPSNGVTTSCISSGRSENMTCRRSLPFRA